MDRPPQAPAAVLAPGPKRKGLRACDQLPDQHQGQEVFTLDASNYDAKRLGDVQRQASTRTTPQSATGAGTAQSPGTGVATTDGGCSPAGTPEGATHASIPLTDFNTVSTRHLAVGLTAQGRSVETVRVERVCGESKGEYLV